MTRSVADAFRALVPVLSALADALDVSVAGAPPRPGDAWVSSCSCAPLGRRRFLALVASGDLPAVREGRRVLVRRADLDAYLAARLTRRSKRDGAPKGDAALDGWLAKNGVRRGGRAA